jgi:hypothetical protein
MVIILSIEESESQIISGFPEYVDFSTNVPATVFFTLDGTDPDENSEMATDRMFLPTDGLTVTLKAIAIAGTMESDILEESWSTDQSDLDKSRLLGEEGINVFPADGEVVASLSVDADGSPSQSSSIPIVDLDLKASTTNRIGEEIPGGATTLDFVNFSINTIDEGPPQVSSPDQIDFDPKAQLIVVDGSTQEALDNQLVRVINRPHGTMDVVSPFLQARPEELDLISGNFVRYMINPKTGKIVFYYRESRENRWIKSIQQTEPKTIHLTKIASGAQGFTFQWIEDRAMTKIF